MPPRPAEGRPPAAPGGDGRQRMAPPGVNALVRRALAEDRYRQDRTGRGLRLGDLAATAAISAEAPGALSGAAAAAAAARRAGLAVGRCRPDGRRVRPGSVVLTVSGRADRILAAERTMLNLLMHLSGVATATRRAVGRAGPLRVRGTRKTIPGLRDLEKAAIGHGGGEPNRRDLSDGLLLKNNHLALVPLATAVGRLRGRARSVGPLQVEVRSFEEARAALDAGARHLLLDNFPPGAARRTIARLRSLRAGATAEIELSGGITPDTIARYATSGADAASLGWLTHSAPALPFHLRIRRRAAGGRRRR